MSNPDQIRRDAKEAYNVFLSRQNSIEIDYDYQDEFIRKRDNLKAVYKKLMDNPTTNFSEEFYGIMEELDSIFDNHPLGDNDPSDQDNVLSLPTTRPLTFNELKTLVESHDCVDSRVALAFEFMAKATSSLSKEEQIVLLLFINNNYKFTEEVLAFARQNGVNINKFRNEKLPAIMQGIRDYLHAEEKLLATIFRILYEYLTNPDTYKKVVIHLTKNRMAMALGAGIGFTYIFYSIAFLCGYISTIIDEQYVASGLDAASASGSGFLIGNIAVEMYGVMYSTVKQEYKIAAGVASSALLFTTIRYMELNPWMGLFKETIPRELFVPAPYKAAALVAAAPLDFLSLLGSSIDDSDENAVRTILKFSVDQKTQLDAFGVAWRKDVRSYPSRGYFQRLQFIMNSNEFSTNFTLPKFTFPMPLTNNTQDEITIENKLFKTNLFDVVQFKEQYRWLDIAMMGHMNATSMTPLSEQVPRQGFVISPLLSSDQDTTGVIGASFRKLFITTDDFPRVFSRSLWYSSILAILVIPSSNYKSIFLLSSLIAYVTTITRMQYSREYENISFGIEAPSVWTLWSLWRSEAKPGVIHEQARLAGADVACWDGDPTEHRAEVKNDE